MPTCLWIVFVVVCLVGVPSFGHSMGKKEKEEVVVEEGPTEAELRAKAEAEALARAIAYAKAQQEAQARAEAEAARKRQLYVPGAVDPEDLWKVHGTRVFDDTGQSLLIAFTDTNLNQPLNISSTHTLAQFTNQSVVFYTVLGYRVAYQWNGTIRDARDTHYYEVVSFQPVKEGELPPLYLYVDGRTPLDEELRNGAYFESADIYSRFGYALATNGTVQDLPKQVFRLNGHGYWEPMALPKQARVYPLRLYSREQIGLPQEWTSTLVYQNDPLNPAPPVPEKVEKVYQPAYWALPSTDQVVRIKVPAP